MRGRLAAAVLLLSTTLACHRAPAVVLPSPPPQHQTQPSTLDALRRQVDALLAAESLPLQDFEKGVHYFPGCQPIEVIAASGPQSLRFGPMKPVGLRDPRTGMRPWRASRLNASCIGRPTICEL